MLSKDYIIPPPYGGSWRWLGALQGNLTWSLDFWGKQSALIDKAHDTEQAAMLDAQGAKLALSGAFAQIYVNLMLAWQNGDIADRTVAERSEILQLTQSRASAGLENQQAVEQATALLSLAKIDQMRFAVKRELDIHAIAALTGQGAAGYAGITPAATGAGRGVAVASRRCPPICCRAALMCWPRWRAVSMPPPRGARRRMPTSIPASISPPHGPGRRSGSPTCSAPMPSPWAPAPTFHLPIFDAGKIRAQYAGATAQLDLAVADYNNAAMDAIKQAADAMSQVKSLKGQRAEQDAALASAEKSFALAEERYKAGLSNQIVMLNAESTLLQAREQAAALASSDVSQRITLMLSVGGGFNPPAVPTKAADAAPPNKDGGCRRYRPQGIMP